MVCIFTNYNIIIAHKLDVCVVCFLFVCFDRSISKEFVFKGILVSEKINKFNRESFFFPILSNKNDYKCHVMEPVQKLSQSKKLSTVLLLLSSYSSRCSG
mmetsp:Transcript_32660/g.37153  ORF Transcript_32660/g.37153 Transcript_32660/m.37153 type:complete len:100 (-) Transcript_32660:649-948(-)